MKIDVEERVIRSHIVRLHDRLDAFSAGELRGRLEQLFEQGASRFVIDLSAVPFLDSAGLGALVSAMKRARLAGGDVVLVPPHEDVARRILRLTQLDRVFTTADTAEEALGRF